MSEKFNPNEYMTYIKDKPYLKPAHRVLWFKLENGHDGAITTELVQFEPFPIVKAYVHLKGEIIASAYGTAQVKQGTVYFGREVEKAETAAIGRALSYAGYGTQFSEDDDDEDLADSPIGKSRQNRATSPASASNGNGQAPHSQTSQNSPSSAPKNGNGIKGAEQFPNPLLCNSVYYNKGKDGAYMLFRGKANDRQSVTTFGGREKLIEAMSYNWNDETLDAIQKWESGKVYPIPDTLVTWEQKDDHKHIVSLKIAEPV